MHLLIQRVKEASVTVNTQVCGQIGAGLLVFLGIHKNDTPATLGWLIQKLISHELALRRTFNPLYPDSFLG